MKRGDRLNKKLPSIYKNTNYNHINNNKKVFYSNSLNNETIIEKPSKNVDEEYILNTPVIIETYSEKLNTKIVSKIKDHIVTSTNRVIKIKEIKSINTLV